MGRYRRQLLAAAIVAVLLALYAVAGFWAVPHFARAGLTDYVRSRYGRTLRIGDIRCNPFTLRAEVDGLEFPDADGAPLIAFRRLAVDLQLATLWRFAPSFREIRLEAPYVRAVIRPGGALNLGDLARGAAAPAAPQATPAKPLRLYIARLSVREGRGTFEDRTRASAFRADFTPVSFELRDFSTVAGNGNAYRLSAASPQGERLEWQGTFTLDPFTSRGAFDVRDLKARTLWEYVRASVPFEILAGVLTLQGDYSLDSGNGPLDLQLLVHRTTLDELALRPPGTPEDYLQLRHLELAETHVDLTHRQVQVGRGRLAGGHVRAWLDAQGLNLLRLAAAAAPAAGTPAVAVAHAGPAPPPWTLAAPDIALEGLAVSLADRTVTPALELEVTPLRLTVAGFSTAPDARLRIECEAPLAGGGGLSAQAQLVPATASGTAHVRAHELALARLQPYLARYTSMTLTSGALEADLDLERRADGALGASGEAHVRQLRTVDNVQHRDFVTWRELTLAGIEYHSRPQALRIKSVLLTQPFARLIIYPDRTLNLSAVLAPAGKVASAAAAPAPAASPGKVRPGSAAAPPPAAVTPFPLAIGSVRLQDATLDYTDLWIKPSFAIGIQSLHGAVTGLSSDPRSRARVQLDGKVERYSPAHIGGEVNLLSAALYTDITMSFKDIDLTIVNPYSGHFVGYRIDKGKLSVDVSYHVERRALAAQQHFVLDQLELGERVESPDAVHMPLKLAVALLKDRNGVIDVNLPMAGTLDDPHFRIGPLIWQAVVNLLVKAATAPFALLGHLFGGGEHVNEVEFAPGSALLEPAAQQQLQALAKGLRERPQLKLDVPIVAAPALDGPPLAQAALERALLARQHGKSAALPAEPAQVYRLLLAQFRDSLGKDTPLPPAAQAVEAAHRRDIPPYQEANEALTAALIAHAPAADAELEALGKERARAIQDALLSGGDIDPARVFIVAGAAPAAAGPKVKVELALK